MTESTATDQDREAVFRAVSQRKHTADFAVAEFEFQMSAVADFGNAVARANDSNAEVGAATDLAGVIFRGFVKHLELENVVLGHVDIRNPDGRGVGTSVDLRGDIFDALDGDVGG